MTTTETLRLLQPKPPQECEGCHEVPATATVFAQHLDPDDDGTGRMIGWSRPIPAYLCDDCIERWHDDPEIGVCSVSWL